VKGATAASQGTFVRGLGLFDATTIVAGAMIGSGIFIVSQDIAKTVGSSGWLLAVWAVTAVMTVMELSATASLRPCTRAPADSTSTCASLLAALGFLYGWTLFMVIQSGSIAAVGVAFAKYLV